MASNTTSGWANTNFAMVRPRGVTDTENGGATWGEPYQIECTWRAPLGEARAIAKDRQGRDVVPQYQVYTEDVRPRIFDQILIDATQADWREILSRDEDDMSMFGEPPAFVLRC